MSFHTANESRPPDAKTNPTIQIRYRHDPHGLCGYYWVGGPALKEVFGTKDEALAAAREAIKEPE